MTLSDAKLATLHPLMRDFIDHLALRGRDGTATTVADCLYQFNTWALATSLDPVAATRDHLEAFQGFLVTEYRTPRGQPLARITASARISHLKSWYRWLTDRGHLVADPSRNLGIRVVASRVVKKEYLDLQECTALVQMAASITARSKPGGARQARWLSNLCAICLTLATGRRVSGICCLTVAAIDLDRGEVRIDREKGHVGRVLPVAGWAMEVVRWYLRDGRPLLTRGHDTPWMFIDSSGLVPVRREVFGHMLKKLIRATIRENPDLIDLPGKRISWHSLRVSYATLLFQNGCDIRSVNELMLHRDLSTTAKYTIITIEDMRQGIRNALPSA
jgi:integrase/recombinase XerD